MFKSSAYKSAQGVTTYLFGESWFQVLVVIHDRITQSDPVVLIDSRKRLIPILIIRLLSKSVGCRDDLWSQR